jgi:hypothetical protein
LKKEVADRVESTRDQEPPELFKTVFEEDKIITKERPTDGKKIDES